MCIRDSCISVDPHYRQRITGYHEQLQDIYKRLGDLSPEDLAGELLEVVTGLNTTMDSAVEILYYEVFDLIPGTKAAEVDIMERTRRLKACLAYVDGAVPSPDVVLIEYQMRQNDISRAVSHQIAMHYETPAGIPVIPRPVAKTGKGAKSTKGAKSATSSDGPSPVIHVAVANQEEAEGVTPTTFGGSACKLVTMVGTTLKNSYSFHESVEYRIFISEYSNYVANKKHTVANFEYYLNLFSPGTLERVKKVQNKLNDISDAFMMNFAWCKKEGLI